MISVGEGGDAFMVHADDDCNDCTDDDESENLLAASLSFVFMTLIITIELEDSLASTLKSCL